MNISKLSKHIIVYLAGLFLLGLGITFSVKADFGVSPVSSLAYSITLITNLSLGITVFLANILFIIVQIIISKEFKLTNYFAQIMMTFIFSLFVDITMRIGSFLPIANTLFIQIIYLILSLVCIALATFLYLHTSLPLMPYDTLLPTISNRFNIQISKTKVLCDVSTVSSALILSFIFLHSLGSVGIGTLVSALLVGRILGVFIILFKKSLLNWMNSEEYLKRKQA